MTTDNMKTPIEDVNIDALLEQAKIFISPQAVDLEIEWRIFKTKDCNNGLTVVFHPDGDASRLQEPALIILGMEKLRKDVIDYLAHESVEELYDMEFDLQAKLELACRKEEVSRRIQRTITGIFGNHFVHGHVKTAAA